MALNWAVAGLLLALWSLAGGLSTLVWVAWAVGAVLIVLLGLASSAVIVMMRSGKSLPWKR